MKLGIVAVCLLVLFAAALATPFAAFADPVLAVSPSALSATATEGSTTVTKTLTVSNTGNKTLKWSFAKPTVSWLSVSPTSGTNTGAVTATVKTQGLTAAASPYSTSLVVSGNGQTVTVPVTLTVTPAAPPPSPPQTDWALCASENEYCAFTGTKLVRYGAGGAYYSKTLTDGTACTNAVFGDPFEGVPKQCDVWIASVTVSRVSISGPASVMVGQTAEYAATATYSDGSSRDVTAAGLWTTSNTSLASMTGTGVLFTSTTTGSVNLVANYGGVASPPFPVTLTSARGTPPSPAIYVSVAGSDANKGTQTSPVQTVQRAIALVNQVTSTTDVTVLIAQGVYREAVNIFPVTSTKALTLQGAGSGTVLTGADDWSTGWTLQSDGSYAHVWPYQWGVKPVPNGWEGYWNWDGNGTKRDIIRRSEMVYLNGLPLRGVLTSAELSAPGTFYVDELSTVIFMRLPTGVALAGSLVEVGTRTNVLNIIGRNNVTVRNLAVIRSRGAVQDDAFHITNLQNATLDGIVVQWTAYTGVGTSYITGLTIRNSLFSDNGVDAITGLGNNNILFEDNEVSRNNWRGWPAEHKGFDTVGKWSESRDMTMRRSRFIDNWGHGPWFDGDNQRVIVDNVFSARNHLRGISLEMNAGPITIRNSKICQNGLVGLSNARSNKTTIDNSQIFDNGFFQLLATGDPNPTTITDSRTGTQYLATGANWTVTNNIIKGGPLTSGIGWEDAGGNPNQNACAPGPCGWAFWTAVEDDDVYKYVKTTLISDYNQWFHSSTTKAFRVPDVYGQAVDLATFRSLMSTVQTNDVHSVWGISTALSCTP
jgi:hypothetical protein